MRTVLTMKNAYQEDVSPAHTGSVLIAHPCTVYSITASMETGGDAVINIADDALAYSKNDRIEQICLTDETHTIHLEYPYGKKFSAGLVATTNKAGVDLSVTYE